MIDPGLDAMPSIGICVNAVTKLLTLSSNFLWSAFPSADIN